MKPKVYLEYRLNGEWDNRFFSSMAEYFDFVFNPDIEVLKVNIDKGVI